MPSIEILSKHEGAPTVRAWAWPETRDYVADDGTRAVFSNPLEFHMGAYSWEVEVTDKNLNKRLDYSGLICPLPYQPWSNDSTRLLLASWKEGAFFYEISSGSSTQCALSGLTVSALGSRRLPRFIVVTDKGSYLIGSEGHIQSAINLWRPTQRYPYLNWLDGAGQFFGIDNEGHGRATIRFFDGRTGEPTEAIPLNPSTVFPYDEGKYLSLKRDYFALVLSPSTQCVGSLLDEWSGIEFDENIDVLNMRVYRPVGEIFEKRGQPVCKVAEHRLELRLLP